MRRRDPSHVWGNEFAALIEKTDLMKEIAQCRAALKVALAVLRMTHLLRSLGVPFHKVATIKDPEARKEVVSLVQRLTGALPRDKLPKLLGLTRSRFQAWSRNLLACIGSPLSLCRKVFPGQLTAKEVAAIRPGISDPSCAHHPAISVAWNLINSRKLSVHVQTICRYARTLGLTVSRGNSHRSRKRASITTTRPNEAWRLDVTIVTALDHNKAHV